MSDVLYDRLDELAREAVPTGLDLTSVRQRARRRTTRRRSAAGAALVVAVAVALGGGGFSARDMRGSVTADRPTTGTAPVPSEARLADVLAQVDPPVTVGRVMFCCEGPIRRPDSTNRGEGPFTVLPFGRDDRTMTSPELVMLAGKEGVQVNWSVVDPPMTDQEADDLARGVVPPDPNPIPVPASTRLSLDRDGDVHSVVYLIDRQLEAAAWARDGGYARASGPAGARPSDGAARLNQIVRDLLQPAKAPPATAATAPVPTSKALHAAVDRALPGSAIDVTDQLPRRYLPAGTTAFSGRTSTGRVRAHVTPADGVAVSVLWEGLDRPLDADEANTLVDSLTAGDPQGHQPPAQLLHEEFVVGGDVRAYQLADPLRTGHPVNVVVAWSLNGTYATLTRPARVGDAATVQRLITLARLLVAADGRQGQ